MTVSNIPTDLKSVPGAENIWRMFLLFVCMESNMLTKLKEQ